MRSRLVRSLVVLGLATGALAQEPELLVVPLGERGRLELAVPVGWRHALRQPPGGLPPTLRFTSVAEPTACVALLTPLWLPGGQARPFTAAQLMALRQSEVAELGSEATPALFEIEGAMGFGFTHRDPEAPRHANGYEHVTRVHVGLEEVDLTATILTRTESSPLRQAALALVVSAKLARERAATIPVTLALPEAPWSVRFDLPVGFSVTAGDTDRSRRSARLEGESDDGWILTAFIEPHEGGESAISQRDAMVAEVRARHAKGGKLRKLSKGLAKLGEIRTWEDGDRAIFSHDLVIAGEWIHRSWNIIMTRDGRWIDIHLTRTPHQPQHDETFLAVLRSVRYGP